MKVYIARRGYEYEGFEPIGVAKTKEGAQKIIDETEDFLDPIYDIEEFELKD